MALSELAHSRNPGFRPPLRYLIGFYADAGRELDALKVAEKFRKIEPAFSIDRLANDRLYPASLLHRAPDIDVARIAALA